MEVSAKVKAKRRHLNAQDCEELGQSAEGTDVLTQPLTSNHGRGDSNPHWRLYPRTPTKRRKTGPASGSPSGQQQSIKNFFAVTNHFNTSPNKSSPTAAGSKEKPNFVEGEENNAGCSRFLPVPKRLDYTEKNDEIDDSVLADLIIPDPDWMDDDEMDDISLLDIPLASESVSRIEPEVDYLEGMTAEMFGDDEHFNGRKAQTEEEEEVEPLPDAHYGLLGGNKALIQPHGCIDDLPEEVLRQILCHVPAQDLYRGVSLVCHRWRNIFLDAKFLPFKKLYYRYAMMEEGAVREMLNVLLSSRVKNPILSRDGIRNLVIYMAQHKVGERVRPEDVLERVKKHRLFPQAESSIRSRIPSIQRQFPLDVQGPNPYAAMAVILMLSESVADVRDLVSLLSGCLSLTAIKEYLSHMATMLLALSRNGIQISSKPHYSIYYVLHLLENGPFSTSSAQCGTPQRHLTGEQQQILNHKIQNDHVVKIIAFAGTGKTTTLMEYAKQHQHLRFLYVAFNTSVAMEARRRFPPNVECRTAHSLAFSKVGKSYKIAKKLTGNVSIFAISCVLPQGRGGFIKSRLVASTLNTFMASADPAISHRHVPRSHVSTTGHRTYVHEDEITLFVQDAQRIWDKMVNLKEKSESAYNMPHDGYLKLWQLQDPKPCLSRQYDVLFIDEAQDCTPVIMDVLLSQSCGKILVGDPHQQIYTFRGAVNALQVVPHTHIYYLTQSFRFGAEIAYVAATILKVCKKVEKILVGGKQKGGVCDGTGETAMGALSRGVSQVPGKTAFLSRCNLGVFTEAVNLTNVNPCCRIHFIGEVKNIGLDKILDLWHLFLLQQSEDPRQRRPYFKDSLIRSFSKKSRGPFSALKIYAEQSADKELFGKITIVERYRDLIPELLLRLNSCAEADYRYADFIVGTVHKAKGLEFDTVIVNDDFAEVPCSSHNLHQHPRFAFSGIPADEWNLLYVAVTRAKTSLVITKNISRILSVDGEYFLRSEVHGPLVSGADLPRCAVPLCPGSVTPNSAFAMSRAKLTFTDHQYEGGPLCERCASVRIGEIAYLMTDDIPPPRPQPQVCFFPQWENMDDQYI